MLSLALLFVIVFFSPFSSVIISIGEERELSYVLLVHLFVYFARIDVCPTSLPLGVAGWLRLMIVAFPGLFHYLYNDISKQEMFK